MSNALLEIKQVKKYFPLKNGLKKSVDQVRAVDDVSLTIRRGETLGLVGESGSGKTTLAKMILGLLPPTEGQIILDGQEIGSRTLRKKIATVIGAVFQDPASSLNPRNTVYQSLLRPLLINGYTKTDAHDLILETAERVNLGRELLARFPFELSGGQQQRVSIARAVMLRPKLLVLDEPTSALDVSVQAQTLNELLELQQTFGLTYLFISHNLSVVRYMSDRISVLYGGKLMEMGPTAEIYETCQHPYTISLLTSMPPQHPKQRTREKHLLTGEMPSLIEAEQGCRFRSRCRFAQDKCGRESPQITEQGEGHRIACFFPQAINQSPVVQGQGEH